jgi:peptidoglycan/LPS O-acetylase OafA/YrhL
MTPVNAGDVQGHQLVGQSARHSPESSASSETGRFHVLDGWRGICALLVALHHLRLNGYVYDVPAVRNAYLFVDFFFVLSGFVISHAYATRVNSLNSVLIFIVRRFGRLWPLHMVVILAFVLVQLCIYFMTQVTHTSLNIELFEGDYALDVLPSHIALIHSLGLYESDTWNDPSWSISVEFYLYIVFAMFCFALPKHRSTVFLGLAFLSVLIIAVNVGRIRVTFDLGFFRGLYGFSIGYVVYHVWKRRPLNLRWPGVWELGAVAATFVFVSVCAGTPASLMGPLLFGIVVWVFAHEAGPVSSLLRRHSFIFLGAISYSVYMVHALVANVMYYGVRTLDKITAVDEMTACDVNLLRVSEGLYCDAQYVMDGLMLVYALAVLLTASFTYRYVEQPGRRYFNRLSESISSRRASRSVSKTAAG